MRRESEAQKEIRAAAAKRGIKLFRNNVGVLINPQGVPIRFGLANESKNMCDILKSSDLIGYHIGTGRFVAVECKKPGWKYSGTAREIAQKNFLDLITKGGGAACFATRPDDLNALNI